MKKNIVIIILIILLVLSCFYICYLRFFNSHNSYIPFDGKILIKRNGTFSWEDVPNDILGRYVSFYNGEVGDEYFILNKDGSVNAMMRTGKGLHEFNGYFQLNYLNDLDVRLELYSDSDIVFPCGDLYGYVFDFTSHDGIVSCVMGEAVFGSYSYKKE